LKISKAEKTDLPRILELQYSAYQSEAVRYNDFFIPPLKQTLAEAEQEYDGGFFLKATVENAIVGSVRAYSEGKTAIRASKSKKFPIN